MNTKRGGFSSIFLVLVIVFAPLAAGDPEFRDISLSTIKIDGASDFIALAPGDIASTGTRITIQSPELESDPLILSQNLEGICSSSVQSQVNLDGTRRLNADCWTIEGNLDSLAADGTFTVTVDPINYRSENAGEPEKFMPAMSLLIQGKRANFGVSDENTQTQTQLWNWLQTPANTTWSEPSTTSGGITLLTTDPEDEANDEDPDLSVYYTTPSGDPSAVTGQATINCPNLNLTGFFQRGPGQSLNTTGFFTTVSGFQPSTTDLTGVPTSTTTTLTDLGAGFNGSHNDTVAYDNVLGTSYQFTARNGTAGPDVDGMTFFAEPGQCNEPLPDTTGFGYDPDAFNVQVSQGQCSIDNTTVSINSANDITGAETLDVFLINAENGMVVQTYNETDFFSSPTNRHFFLSTFIPTGDWILLGLSDQQGLGTNDHYAREAFNVKEGHCTDTVQEITIDNVTITVTDALLTVLIDNTLEHRNATLELNAMDFEGLSFDGFLYFLFFVIIAALCYWHGWTFNALVATLAFLTMFFPDPPIGSIGFIYLLAVGFMLEYFVGGLAGLRKRFRKDHDGDDGNFMNN